MIKPVTGIYDVDAQTDPYISEYEFARDSLRKKDWHEGLKELERLAYRGSIMSVLLVSDAMRIGWMYEQDLIGAETWYRVAVDSGSARGFYGLGLTYLKMERFDEAIQNLEMAISREYAPAYNALAEVYSRGDGVPVESQRAFSLWKQGADLGHLPAKRNLVRELLHGRRGLLGRIQGALNILPLAMEFVNVRKENPYTDRLR